MAKMQEMVQNLTKKVSSVASTVQIMGAENAADDTLQALKELRSDFELYKAEQWTTTSGAGTPRRERKTPKTSHPNEISPSAASAQGGDAALHNVLQDSCPQCTSFLYSTIHHQTPSTTLHQAFQHYHLSPRCHF